MKQYNLRIEQEESPESPREWDNLGTMICFHGRYNLGDDHNYNPSDFDGWADMEHKLSKEFDGVLLPLYLYDHSGITMNTTGFNCPWDSGQVGFIGISKAKIRKEFSVRNVTRDMIARVTNCLIGEVETYDQYLAGELYGYIIEDENGEHVDSCWGYYGYEHAEEEGKAQLEYRKSQVSL